MGETRASTRPVRAETRALPAAQQFAAWHALMWRIDLARGADAPVGFDAALGIERARSGVELWNHMSDAVDVRRDARRCRRDGGDEIYVALALEGDTRTEQDGHRLRSPAGSLYVADFARPLSACWSRHRELALVIPRERAERALAGRGPGARLRNLAQTGAAALLAAQMRALAREAHALSPALLDATLDHCADLALYALAESPQAERLEARDVDVLHHQALRLIERHCADPEFGTARLAELLCVSRSRLFEAFRAREHGLEASLWRARLERAHALLGLYGATRPIAEVALACGFLDPAGFSRMYRRRYGMRPQERRAQGK